MILKTQSSTVELLPLNEIDVENLNGFFKQQGLASNLDQDKNQLLRLNQSGFDLHLTKQSDYNQLLGYAHESLKAMVHAGDEIMNSTSFGSLCESLESEVGGSKIGVWDYCKANMHNSTIKDIFNEMQSISNDRVLSHFFNDFHERYGELKADWEAVGSHIANEIRNSNEEQKINLVGDYTKASSEFKEEFQMAFDKIYITIKHGNESINLQDDFNGFIKTNNNAVLVAQPHNQKSLDNSNTHSMDNSI